MNKPDKAPYELPFKYYLKMTPWQIAASIVFMLFFGSFPFMPIDISISVKAIGIILSLTIFLTTVVTLLGKSYFEITEEYVFLKTVWGIRSAKWSDIKSITIVSMQHQKFIGINVKEHIRKKQSFLVWIDYKLGNSYYLSIPFSLMKGVDIECLYLTLINRAEAEYKENLEKPQEDIPNDSIEMNNKASESSLYSALFKTFIASLLAGTVSGIALHFQILSILITSILGMIFILYVYWKSYEEKGFNILIRLFVGFVCSLQIIIAFAVLVVIKTAKYNGYHSILEEIIGFFVYTIENFSDSFIVYAAMAICFLFGFFQGKTFRFQRIISKIFMRKLGDYYYKREDDVFNIYLIDPVDYDEEEPGKLLARISHECLIEKNGKYPGAFYIPVEIVKELGVTVNIDTIVKLEDKDYYMLYLYGHTNCESYVYPCFIVCSKNKRAELLQIQYL